MSWRRVLGWFGLLVVVAVVVVAVIYLGYVVFWPVSDSIARHDVGAIAEPHRAAALQKARDAARGRLLTFGAGLFAAGALVYTALNFRLSRQGQVTDRYTKAVEQLGSEMLDVRIGGIYSLERIARDSARDHPTVIEVLAAFVREHSPEPWPPAKPSAHEPRRTTQPDVAAPGDQTPNRTTRLKSVRTTRLEAVKTGAPMPMRTTRPDVQAAITVIARRNPRHDSRPVNLAGADLENADLPDADLTEAFLKMAVLSRAHLIGADLTHANLTYADLLGANLTDATLKRATLIGALLSSFNLDDGISTPAHLIRANLTGANLTGANLTHARLEGARLTGANLTGADLAGADLTGADLTNARLERADLADADLTGADLTDADLTGADLTGADLTGADLTDADLTGADLTGALFPSGMTVPEGWVRDDDSGRLRRADG